MKPSITKSNYYFFEDMDQDNATKILEDMANLLEDLMVQIYYQGNIDEIENIVDEMGCLVALESPNNQPKIEKRR